MMLPTVRPSVFAEVVEAGSFASAARQLGVSRSAVSKAVANLERNLNARFFNRSTRHLTLTEAGAAFAEHCRRIKQEAAYAYQAVDILNASPRGTLRLAASVAFGTRHVAPALAEFLHAYPDIDVDMTIIDRPVDCGRRL